jgi:hypothetical protein
MHRNLKIYGGEAERSHVQEEIVSTVWALLIVGMIAGSLLGWHSEPAERAKITTASVVLPAR